MKFYLWYEQIAILSVIISGAATIPRLETPVVSRMDSDSNVGPTGGRAYERVKRQTCL